MKRTERDSQGTDAMTRLAAIGGVIGPILFAVLVVVGGMLYNGYSHVGQKISELGGEGAEYAILQNLNFLMIGVLVIGFSWGLGRVLGPPYVGPVLIAFFGLSSSIANGLLPCDVGCKGQTSVGLLHNITGVAGFLAAIVGMFVLARRWSHDPRWQTRVNFTRATALVAIVGLAWFVVTQAADAQTFAGIAQRVFVSAFLLWISVTALRLYRESARDSRQGLSSG